MVDIFEYLDYRKFLKDYYQNKKSENRSFSYKVFANKAKFKSKSSLVHVTEGKVNLSKKSVISVANALGLKGKALHYFETLVEFNQEKNPVQKSKFLPLLASYNQKKGAKVLCKDSFEFYVRWYHNTIRELVTIIDFKNDYSLLGRLVVPQITECQARKSVELLLKLGLIQKKGDLYIQTDKSITTGEEVVSAAVTDFHIENLKITKNALEKIPPEQRDISSIVGGMSESCFNTVKNEIQQFRKKIMEIIGNDQEEAEKVYHINFQVFPTSKQRRRI